MYLVAFQCLFLQLLVTLSKSTNMMIWFQVCYISPKVEQIPKRYSKCWQHERRINCRADPHCLGILRQLAIDTNEVLCGLRENFPKATLQVYVATSVGHSRCPISFYEYCTLCRSTSQFLLPQRFLAQIPIEYVTEQLGSRGLFRSG